jgi:UDP-2-acetamido-3-amino-2,3-dideoxy-glucuronate N-acetyltransferase
MAFLKHDQALVESPSVGAGTRVRAFAHVCATAKVGRNCDIGEHALISDGVVVGDCVTVGAKATIAPGQVIGPYAMVEPDAVVTADVPAYTIVAGNPARALGAVRWASTEPVVAAGWRVAGQAPVSTVRGVQIFERPLIEDFRGALTFAETAGAGLPFLPQRFFVISEVPHQQVRGEHAHWRLKQLLTCLRGQCTLLVDDGEHQEEIALDSEQRLVYVPPLVWGVQRDFSADAILLVFASERYDAADYIRDHDEFLRAVRESRT